MIAVSKKTRIIATLSYIGARICRGKKNAITRYCVVVAGASSASVRCSGRRVACIAGDSFCSRHDSLYREDRIRKAQ
jgi:hypothetical protein